MASTFAVVFSLGKEAYRWPIGTMCHGKDAEVGHVERDTLEQALSEAKRIANYQDIGVIGILNLDEIEGNSLRIAQGVLLEGWAVAQAAKVINDLQDHTYYSQLHIFTERFTY